MFLYRIRLLLWRIRSSLMMAPAAGRLTAIAIAAFIVQQITARVSFVAGSGYYTFADSLTYCFGLHVPLLIRGFFWQPLTYMFLHGSLLHLFLNCFTLFFFGSGVEAEIGSSRFLKVFLIGGIIGGLAWILADAYEPHLIARLSKLGGWCQKFAVFMKQSRNPHIYGVCIGASGGVFALIGAFAACFPERKLLVILLFWPLKIKAIWLAIILGVITVGAAVIGLGQVAYATHLAGGIFGYLYGYKIRHKILKYED